MQIKKILQTIMSVCMALSLVTINSVSAADVGEATFYIQGNETEIYDSLQDAVDAAKDSDTVVIDGSIAVIDETVEILNKDISIDGGYSRIYTYDSIGVVFRISNSSVNFKNVSLNCWEDISTGTDLGEKEVYGIELVDSTLRFGRLDLSYNDFTYFLTLENSDIRFNPSYGAGNTISGNFALLKDSVSFKTKSTDFKSK